MQQQVEANVGDVEKKQWSEVVEDLWDNLHHLRDWGYSDGAFVYDPHTRRYGFQEASEYDSEEDLMAKIDEEESFVSILEDQQPSLHGMDKEEVELSSSNTCVLIEVPSFPGFSPALLHDAYNKTGEEPGREN